MMLPADSHVHSEWSWDTGGPRSGAAGRMRATCAHAVKIGLPTIIFTEHLDIPRTWRAASQDLMPHQQHMLNDDGLVDFAEFDAAGYFESIDRCRHQFPDLQILTGVEFGQPHLHNVDVSKIIDLSNVDRVNGSLHTLQFGSVRAEPHTLFREHPVETVMWEYLAEIPRMVDASDSFEVITHIDYPIRMWPVSDLGPFDPRQFEEGFREAMRAIAVSERALEMNTRRLWPWIPQWWAEEGGKTISFGSDAHEPEAIASHFPEAVAMVEQFGFKPGRSHEAFWSRTHTRGVS